MNRLIIFCALLALTQAWECKFTFGNYTYDLTSANKNSSDPNGLWTTFDINNDYYFKLCEETTTPPDATAQCIPGTQVCQQDFFKHDYSCGVNPVTTAYDNNGGGVVMAATGGAADGCTQGRASFLQVLCPTNGMASGSFGPVTEQQACVYTIPFYHDVGCGKTEDEKKKKNDDGLSGGSVFLIIFFVSLFVYFAAGAGWNAYQGKRGVEMVPQVEFWKDLPFLCKDGVMFLVGKCTGGSGYSSVE